MTDKRKSTAKHAPKRAKDGRWLPGQSGNPHGRNGRITALRKELDNDVEAVIENVRKQALAGDMTAARLILERCVPPLKPQSGGVALDLPENADASDFARAIVRGIAAGGIDPAAGRELLAAAADFAKLLEHSEFEERLSKLEQKR